MPLFAPRVCFVDLETTGSSHARDRVTEVAIVTVEADEAGDAGREALRISEWSSLVNPGVPIPSEIQWLTGITNEMVRGAPGFGELAEEIAARLHESVFVAHNARFDYGFLKSEFARIGVAFTARTLCTVRLSRLLYPDRAPHSLDAIVQRFGLDGEQRHRALGDARVLWRFVQRLYERHPRGEVDDAVARLLSRPSTPAHLPPEALDAVPATPGVYRFYGLNAHPIYIGKSIDLRARVAGHFSADSTRAADARLSQEVRRIEWEETAGEVGALLREAEAVRTELPAHNIALRRRAQAVLLRLDDADADPTPSPEGREAHGAPSPPRKRGPSSPSPRRRPGPDLPSPRLSFVKVTDLPPDGLATDPRLAAAHARGDVFGPFSSRASVRATLIELAREHGLCLRTLGLERGPRRGSAVARAPFIQSGESAATPATAPDAVPDAVPDAAPDAAPNAAFAPTPCFSFQLGRCRGACVGQETLAEHAARLRELIAARRLPAWPAEGALALVEASADRSREDWHVFDAWCWLGTVRTLDAALALAREAPRRFDADSLRILRQALERVDGALLRIEPLSGSRA